jgi:hypothetical protein
LHNLLVAIVAGLTVSVRPCLNAAVLHDSYVATNLPYCLASPEELREALAECSKVHSQLTKEAAMGKFLHVFPWFVYKHKMLFKHLTQCLNIKKNIFNKEYGFNSA